jgi:signal transduction histidine kinase
LIWNPLRRRRLYKLALGLGAQTSRNPVDPRIQAYVEILSVALASSYLLNQSAFAAITFTIFKDSVLKGAGGSVAFAYVCFGFVLVMMQKYKPAIELANIGIKLSEQSLSQAENAKVLMFHGILIEHWRDHLANSVKVLEKGSVAGTVSGEYEYSSFSLSVMCFYAILEARERLSDIEIKMDDALSRVSYMKQNRNIAVIRSNRQWLRGLRGLTPNYDTLSEDSYNEAAHIEHTRETGDKSHIATYYMAKLFSAFLFNDYRKAEGYGRSAEGVIHHIAGQAHYPIYFYLYGLTCLRLLREIRGTGNVFAKLRLYMQAEKYIREVRTFARAVPVNHLHRLYFMRAEKARYRGKFKKALKFFTRAAEAAEENGSLYDRGLIAEHTAFFFRDIGINAAFGEYMRRARCFYSEWEANAKVKLLDELYPELFISKSRTGETPAEAERRPPDRGVDGVQYHDMEAVIGTSLAVSQERYIGRLLDRFMNTVMKISEAHKGLLFEKRGESFVPKISAENRTPGGCIVIKQVFDLIDRYSIGVLNYAVRLEETVMYKAGETDRFAADAYIGLFRPYEIICIPIAIYRQVKACLYLEYTEVADTPDAEALDFIRSLAVQAVLSIEREHLRERERKLLEKNKEQLLKTMQAEKLASVGLLVAEVAHEVDNPNQAILLNAENLNESACDIIALLDELSGEEDFSIRGLDYRSFREEYPRIIESIRVSARQIEQLVAEVRDYVRPKREFERKEVDVNEVIDSTVLIASHFIKKSTVDFSISKGKIPPVLGDFQKLQQVFLNLIRNACQAVSETRGWVKVRTTFRKEGETVEVGIEDKGPGMEPSLLEEIEEPFFSTRQDRKGLGLGLYVSSTIVKKHGGEIFFDSRPGEGTNVRVFLPAVVSKSGVGRESS